MDIEYAKSLSYETVRKLYKSYLQSIELDRNTENTFCSDAFYLWNNAGKELFWDSVFSNDFETVARDNLFACLSDNTSGIVNNNRVAGYLSSLRRFRNFILTYKDSSEEDREALKAFLLDIDCLDALSVWTSKFNLFDVLRIARTEIRHSNILAWLLNPNENHGLGDLVLRGMLHYVVSSFSDDNDVFDVLLMDCYSFSVFREWHSIDILAVSEDSQYVLCIENKIDSKEHDNQLKRYKRIVDDTYPTFRKLFVYLTPEGDESSDPENWCSMSYKDILDIIEKARSKASITKESSLLIDNYIDTIRRDVVGDEQLARICAEIYAKHQRALDLIFENRPDKASRLADILHAWATVMTEKGELEFVPEKSAKTYTRFKTKTMSALMPDAMEAKSGWGTSNYYFYEIRNINGDEFFIQLALSSKNIPDNLRIVCEQINKIYPSRQQKTNWQWRVHFKSKHTTLKDDEELTDEFVFDQLSKHFEEVKRFESKLVKQLHSAEEHE